MTAARSELYEKGDALRRELLGESAYARLNENYTDPAMRAFIDVCTESLFGAMWARPGLDMKTRTLVCIVSDIAQGCEPELAIHIRFALNQGWMKEELVEVIVQMIGYVGAPLARAAMLVARKTFDEIHAENAA